MHLLQLRIREPLHVDRRHADRPATRPRQLAAGELGHVVFDDVLEHVVGLLRVGHDQPQGLAVVVVALAALGVATGHAVGHLVEPLLHPVGVVVDKRRDGLSRRASGFVGYAGRAALAVPGLATAAACNSCHSFDSFDSLRNTDFSIRTELSGRAPLSATAAWLPSRRSRVPEIPRFPILLSYVIKIEFIRKYQTIRNLGILGIFHNLGYGNPKLPES